MKPITPRPYQRDAIDRGLCYLTDTKLRGRRGIIVAPTGSGKSVVIAGIATALDGPCVVFQPSREILAQNAQKLAAYGYRPAIFSASFGERRIGQITLATIGSVIRHAEAFRDIRYVLIDEAHLVNAKGGQYKAFLEVIERARVLGLTATPFRLASNSFGSELRFLTRTRPRVFQDVVHVTQLRDLFAAGYLCPLRYRKVEAIHPGQLRLNSTGADYTDESIREVYKSSGFASRLEEQVRGLVDDGRKVLVFTRFIEESEHLAAAIPGAVVVTGETPQGERDEILRDFRQGRIPAVSNVGVLTTGFDYPELDTVVVARPTMSLALWYQMVGRAIRPHPTKPYAGVVDMVGNLSLFGRVQDLELRAGGPKRDKWQVVSRGRALTNVILGEPRSRPGEERRWAA